MPLIYAYDNDNDSENVDGSDNKNWKYNSSDNKNWNDYENEIDVNGYENGIDDDND